MVKTRSVGVELEATLRKDKLVSDGLAKPNRGTTHGAEVEDEDGAELLEMLTITGDEVASVVETIAILLEEGIVKITSEDVSRAELVDKSAAEVERSVRVLLWGHRTVRGGLQK